MFSGITLDDQLLKKFVRQVSQGDYLFRQGEMGNTMFIVLEGAVLLFRAEHNVERLVGTTSAGEMLCEKALFMDGPYRRTFTAQAKTSTALLEFTAENLKLIQSKSPNFMLAMIRILSARLDESNQMVFLLQSTDNVDRIIRYLLFFCECHSKKVPEGVELVLTAEEIHHAINVEVDQIQAILDELVLQKVLLRRKKGYIVIDETALLDQIAEIRERTAA